jgi:hypothetical protein
MSRLKTKLYLKDVKRALNTNKQIVIDTIFDKTNIKLNIDDVKFWTDIDTEQFGIEYSEDLSKIIDVKLIFNILNYFSTKPYMTKFMNDGIDLEDIEIEYINK